MTILDALINLDIIYIHHSHLLTKMNSNRELVYLQTPLFLKKLQHLQNLKY